MLLDEVCQSPNLEAAWAHVHRRGRRGGVDGVGIEAFRRRLAQRLAAIRSAILARRYVPDPLLAVEIPKPASPGEKRRIAIPTIRDKVAQQAVRAVVEPIFEYHFLPCSYGYRPGKGPAKAIRRLAHELRSGPFRCVLRHDVRNCFDRIPHDVLLGQIGRWLPDPSLDWLFEVWSKSGILLPGGAFEGSEVGIPQGCVLSPLLANVVLHRLDEAMSNGSSPYLRYGDDIIALAHSEAAAGKAFATIERVLGGELGLELKPAAQPFIPISEPFDFLGIRFDGSRRRIAPAKSDDIMDELRRIISRAGRAPPTRWLADLQESIDGLRAYYGSLVGDDSLLGIDRLLAAELRGAWPALARGDDAAFRRGVQQLRWLGATLRADVRNLVGRILEPGRPQPLVRSLLRRQERAANAMRALGSEVRAVEPGAYVGKRGHRLVVRLNGREVSTVRATDVEHIVVGDRAAGCSSSVVCWAAARRIPITYVNGKGEVLSRTEAPGGLSARLVREQIRVQASPWADGFARELVRGKVRNQYNVLRYFAKYEGQSRPGIHVFVGMMERKLDDLVAQICALPTGDLPGLRVRLMAIEGQAAIVYWEGVRLLLDGVVDFPGRMRQGATDLVNRLLNYGYAVLYPRIQNACARQGLDPSIGFLHAEQHGKPALVFDLIEPFRAPVVDRAVLAMLRCGAPAALDADGGLASETRKRVTARVLGRLAAYTRYRTERMRMDAVIEAQCRELAKAILEKRRFRCFAGSW